jgi:hypothetical protein
LQKKLDLLIKDFFGVPKTLLQEMVENEFQGSKNEKKVGIIDEQVPIIIDLGMVKEGKLNEDFLRQFGSWIETALGYMFGMNSIPITVKGTKSQIESFGKTLQSEKKYIEAWHQYGLDDARTHSSKAYLDNAVKGFEKSTGIKYPFK